MQIETRRLEVNGLSLTVRVAGQGPSVLLVHGFPDTHQVWKKQVQPLVKAGYRVILPDTRGCGDSAMPARVRDYKLPLLVADLVGILDSLEIDRVRLVGHDWGAVQAWHLAMAHPARIERLIALSVGHPDAYARGGLKQKLRGWYVLFFQLGPLAVLLMKAFDWALFRRLAGLDETHGDWRSILGRPGRLLAGMNYYRANLGLILPQGGPKLKVPVHMIYSSDDRFLVERQATGSAACVDAPFTYDRIEGVGHWLQLEAPDTVNGLLLRYLA